MPNVRIRGKISRDEWPKIAVRYQNGDTLAEIARSYHCTAPAIRYIVARVSIHGVKGKGKKMDRDKVERIAMLVPLAENQRNTRIGSTEDSPMTDIWGRINTDIATFLAAMDSLSSDDSNDNCEALLAATDRLLWASGRTRLELERVLRNRKKKKGTSIRRISG